jgi:hypothetical protein
VLFFPDEDALVVVDYWLRGHARNFSRDAKLQVYAMGTSITAEDLPRLVVPLLPLPSRERQMELHPLTPPDVARRLQLASHGDDAAKDALQ